LDNLGCRWDLFFRAELHLIGQKQSHHLHARPTNGPGRCAGTRHIVLLLKDGLCGLQDARRHSQQVSDTQQHCGVSSQRKDSVPEQHHLFQVRV
jgi:hypothetical protein